ncbi:Rha family transcriptional regulator [Ilyobacter polytropus]|jgi:Rha family phage regulatory protein|uniref:Phage regulatory protein, Rha family n=1 Tax=Ilyobacter polytropus (strain ATCC 51220 / DSM 2926 / LMG 16218 / CuHBu1) TaxID=572544 RepID=E3H9B3_ILYPC|nr:Rha family transcriptional regulator [Ilyobacter polytropus]ADO82812.1 phage regulatory protein, Rha family [Ilyobacter polytropus DSM 2926]
MTDLIKIENNKDYGLVVSSRVVAEQLGKRHDNVMRDLEGILTTSDLRGLIIHSEYKGGNGQMRKEYFLTKDGFILYMFNIQGHNDFKLAYINKFNEMEKQLKELYVPKSLPEALRAYADAVEEKEKQKLLAIEKQKTIDMLVHENKLYTTTEIAKEMGFKSAIALNIELGERKIQFKANGTWVLYSKYSDLGYVSIKQNVLDTGKIVYDRKWTGEGRKFLLEMFQIAA